MTKELLERCRDELNFHLGDTMTIHEAALLADLDAAIAQPMVSPRFENVSCSQCGQEFGPGNAGFSHCEDHASPQLPATSGMPEMPKPFSKGWVYTEANATHEAFRMASIALLHQHAGHLPADEMLAVAAQMVGQITAMQDQRTMTVVRAEEIIYRNIEIGNASAVADLMSRAGGTA